MKILEALANVQQEIDSIGKDQQGFGYKFRGIDDVFNVFGPLFKKYKILVTRENLKSERTIRDIPPKDERAKPKQYIETILHCDYIFLSLEDQSSIRTQGFGEGQDTSGGDKSSAMATSNAFKYVIFEMFTIPTEEQKDSDQVTMEVETKKGNFSKEDASKAGKGFRKSSDDII